MHILVPRTLFQLLEVFDGRFFDSVILGFAIPRYRYRSSTPEIMSEIKKFSVELLTEAGKSGIMIAIREEKRRIL